jgi:hypothetical protein
MKRVSARTPRVAPAARPPEGQEADVGNSKQHAQNREPAIEADEVVRVVFKAELEADEEPIGRITLVRRRDLEAGSDPGEPGRPCRGSCLCPEPVGDHGETCGRCAADIERWATLIEAEEIAHRRGASLSVD